MTDNLPDSLGATVLAVGALGAAAYGIVDGMKLLPWVDLSGFERLFSSRCTAGGRMWPTKQKAGLDPLHPALEVAYGTDVMELLKAQYRSGRIKGDLPRTLRQGVRIGFGMMPLADVIKTSAALGLPESTTTQAANALENARRLHPPAYGEKEASPTADLPSDDERAALARLETTKDARIDAALVLADTQYVTQTKIYATFVALAIAFGVGLSLNQEPIICFLVGIAAVPLAPVAKDIATALQEAVKAFRGR